LSKINHVSNDLYAKLKKSSTYFTATIGLKLNPIKSQVIVISRCRVDISPPTLLIGSDIIKVVSKVNNLGFVLNERLTATDHLRKV
jgi:hypothetical protein